MGKYIYLDMARQITSNSHHLCSYDVGTTAPNHTVEFAKAAGTLDGHLRTLKAARALSLTAADIFVSDELYEKAVAYFKKGKVQ